MDDKSKKQRSAMSTMQQIINDADALCKSLDAASWDEKRFNNDLCCEFEKMSWQILRLKNYITNLKEGL
jgi:hypothetical protein